jgi:hypothetical protein
VQRLPNAGFWKGNKKMEKEKKNPGLYVLCASVRALVACLRPQAPSTSCLDREPGSNQKMSRVVLRCCGGRSNGQTKRQTTSNVDKAERASQGVGSQQQPVAWSLF